MNQNGPAPENILDEVADFLSERVDEVRAYLASPEGRVLRKRIAQVMIIAAPLLFRARFFRATWIGRILGVVGGAAVVVKLAEALRDWEPIPEAAELS
ncbi:MAG TPA: hypothetical protein VG602_03850 [Actinomycetota bacterium]|nr:hypothetical protein [Actinomycetota bacterium]